MCIKLILHIEAWRWFWYLISSIHWRQRGWTMLFKVFDKTLLDFNVLMDFLSRRTACCYNLELAKVTKYPAGTQHQNDVVSTSMRYDVILTLCAHWVSYIWARAQHVLPTKTQISLRIRRHSSQGPLWVTNDQFLSFYAIRNLFKK